MSQLSVYEYSDYKKFINDWIDHAPNSGRGLRKALAEAIGCQTPFITHVLSSNYHFSPEQAEACARWIGLNEKATEYFILMLMQQRAGTKSLERLFAKQLARKKEQQTILKKRVGIKESLTHEDQAIYYSNWIYAAIHMAILNPEWNTVEALQNKFRLPKIHVIRAVDFLISKGLISQEKSTLKVMKPVLYLDRESALISSHHTQWRLRAIEAIKMNPKDGLYYSGVISLSQADYEYVREKLAKLLEEVANKIKDSKDEKLACLNFDWFEL